jgi:cytochrome c-type biogenesis protein CcmH
MTGQTDWTSAIAILAAGLLAGAIIIFALRRKRSTIDTNLDRKDLEAKRDALIAQLRALPDDAVDERARLERETADVLRQLDSQPSPTTPPPPQPLTTHPSSMNPTIKGFLWGFGSFAALAALAYFVMQSSTPRQQQMQQPATDADPAIAQLQAAIERDPNNLSLRDDLAQAYLERENLQAVAEQTRVVLAKDPNDARALTFQALVHINMGQSDVAVRMLQKAKQADPKNLNARVTLAWVYSQTDMPAAEAEIAQAIQIAPEERVRLEQALQQMKTPQPASGELPPGHPAVNEQPQQPTGKSVRVTLNLESAAPPSGVLFVIARNPAGGPPAAVKRIPVTSFPITVDISQADSMMGQPLPDLFRLEARLDSDGDPLTKPASDPSAALDNVAPGAVVTLALK